MRTMPSVMCKLKQEARKNNPKRVLQFVSEASGGIMEACLVAVNRLKMHDERIPANSILIHCTPSCICAKKEKVEETTTSSEWSMLHHTQ